MKKLILVALFSVSALSHGYGDLGHKSVAALAWKHLTPYGKQNVERILGLGQDAFINASVWADHIKKDERFNYLKPMHYVNMPKDEKWYDRKRDCRKDRCVVEAIKHFSKVAKNGSEIEQILALRMIIHLVADVHQPLHAGLYEDRGGNWYEVHYQGDPVTLHKLWDHQMVERMGEDVESVVAELEKVTATVDVAAPVIWAQESHAITVNGVYDVNENQSVSDEYLVWADGVTRSQMAKAGWRLAMWLNKLW